MTPLELLNSDILLVSDDRIADQLRRVGADVPILHVSEPYEALEELARRPHGIVVVGESVPDLGDFARAARRIGPGARVYALCTPAGEAEIRATVLNDLDDYFLLPPTRDDLEQMLRAETEGTYEPVPRAAAAELSTAEIGALIESAETFAGLSLHLAGMVGRWIGAPVRWADATGHDEGDPLLLLDGADGPQVLLGPPGVAIDPPDQAKLAGLQVLAGPLTGQARRTETLHRLAITDFLTGAYNRRYFYHFTDRLLRRAGAEKFQATVLLYDIDDFKRYNDAYGHAAGDEILCETATLMKAITREHDLVARIGGDEFAVLFWDAEAPRQPDSRHPTEAAALAGRFVEAISRHEFASLGPDAQGALTISGGLATFPWHGRTCRDLLRHADGALRQAKEAGKNAIYIVGQGPIDQT